MTMHRLAFLLRTQFVSLTSFQRPPVIDVNQRALRFPQWRKAAERVAQHARCHATTVGQQEVELSTSAVRRKADEVAGRLDDAAKVGGWACVGVKSTGGRDPADYSGELCTCKHTEVRMVQVSNLAALRQQLEELEHAAGATDLWEQRDRAQVRPLLRPVAVVPAVPLSVSHKVNDMCMHAGTASTCGYGHTNGCLLR